VSEQSGSTNLDPLSTSPAAPLPALVVGARDVKFEGSFEPIVRQHIFDTVQDVLLGRKVVAKAYDHNNPGFLLRVFVRLGSKSCLCSFAHFERLVVPQTGSQCCRIAKTAA